MSHPTRSARSSASSLATSATASSAPSTRGARDVGSKPARPLAADEVEPGPSPASGFAALADAQSKSVANWIAQIRAAQLVWFDLAKTMPAIWLIPLGFRLRPPAAEVTEAQDAADSAASTFALTLGRLSTPNPWLYWLDASMPAHTEEVVA